MAEPKSCQLIRPGAAFDGKQGFSYRAGISEASAGAAGICLHLLEIPPGRRARAHRHDGHETAIYMLRGEVHTWFGDRLEHLVVARAGDFLYIPPGCPHLPWNRSEQPAACLIARTDPNEQESVELLPELDCLVGEELEPDAPRAA